MEGRLIFYYAMFGVGFAVAIIHNLCTHKKNGYSRREAIVFSVSCFLIGMLSAVLMAVVYNRIIIAVSGGVYSSGSRFRLYGTLLFNPPLQWAFMKLIGMDYRRFIDLSGIYNLVCLGFAKCGCAVYGCCYGIECAHGVFNRFTQTTVFPVQLCEALSCFLIALVLWYIRNVRRKYVPTALFPAGMLAYAVMRFLWEFFRDYEYACEGSVLWGLSIWQLFSLLTAGIGAVWLAAVLYRRPKIACRNGSTCNTV